MNVYVHAFVDNNKIINIHNTDYGVWGAGPAANNRYVQVELCQVNSEDQFARSISNDAYYVASKLIQYNLPYIANKTVVSHHQAAQWWGQTTHTDPDGYFAKWGYDMNQFNQLIEKYYNNLKATGSVDGTPAQPVQPAQPEVKPQPDQPSISLHNGVVKANNPASFAVPLLSFNADGSAEEGTRGLANNTGWFTDQSRMYQGHKYYRVSTNEWVEDTYFQFTPSA